MVDAEETRDRLLLFWLSRPFLPWSLVAALPLPRALKGVVALSSFEMRSFLLFGNINLCCESTGNHWKVNLFNLSFNTVKGKLSLLVFFTMRDWRSHYKRVWYIIWMIMRWEILFTFTGDCSSSSESLLLSSGFEGTRNVKQSQVRSACCLVLGNGTIERVVGGGIGGPLGPIPISSNS